MTKEISLIIATMGIVSLIVLQNKFGIRHCKEFICHDSGISPSDVFLLY